MSHYSTYVVNIKASEERVSSVECRVLHRCFFFVPGFVDSSDQYISLRGVCGAVHSNVRRRCSSESVCDSVVVA